MSESSSAVAEFADILKTNGFMLRGPPEMDGKMHRVPVVGDKGAERSGAYVAHLDGIRPAGWLRNFKTGQDQKWKASEHRTLAKPEREKLAAEAEATRRQREVEVRQQHEATAARAEKIWDRAQPADPHHPYLQAKGIGAHDIRQGKDGRLLVPLRDTTGKLWSLQAIGPDGFKQFMTQGRTAGLHHVIGDVSKRGPLLIAEGYSTAATVHELTGQPTIVAFNAGNLAAVAHAWRERDPKRVIVIAADNDHHLPDRTPPLPNVGLERAKQAAAPVGGKVVAPPAIEGARGTDWNDFAQAQGREAAEIKLRTEVRIAERGAIVDRLAAERAAGIDRQRDYERQREEHTRQWHEAMRPIYAAAEAKLRQTEELER